MHKVKEVVLHLNEWGFDVKLGDSFDHSCLWLSKQNSAMINLLCSVVYLTWKQRNELVHGRSEESSLRIAAEAVTYVSGSPPFINCSSGRLDVNQLSLLEDRWRPPPPD